MKLAVIKICADCPKSDCSIRTLCGKIPDKCPLPNMVVCSTCQVFYRKDKSVHGLCPVCLGKTHD